MANDKPPRAALATLAVFGVAAVWYATRWGPGMSFDSVQYLFGARRLASGGGLDVFDLDGVVRPLNWWAPVFSVVLALGVGLGRDAATVARMLNAACFGATVFLCGWMAYRLTRSAGAAIAAAACSLTAVSLVSVFAWAWSEPTFIVVMTLGFLLLDRGLDPASAAAGLVVGDRNRLGLRRAVARAAGSPRSTRRSESRCSLRIDQAAERHAAWYRRILGGAP